MAKGVAWIGKRFQNPHWPPKSANNVAVEEIYYELKRLPQNDPQLQIGEWPPKAENSTRGTTKLHKPPELLRKYRSKLCFARMCSSPTGLHLVHAGIAGFPVPADKALRIRPFTLRVWRFFPRPIDQKIIRATHGSNTDSCKSTSRTRDSRKKTWTAETSKRTQKDDYM